MDKVKLLNVRLSFPSIFKKAVFEGIEGKFEATFLLSKEDTKTKAQIDAVIKQLLLEAKVKVSADKMCIKDGDEVFEEKAYDGYQNHWAIKAGTSRRPTVINRDKTPIVEADNILYAGCYVNAIISFWVQNNKFGKRINANLLGVQFVKDGESFGAGDIDVSNDFEEVEISSDVMDL